MSVADQLREAVAEESRNREKYLAFAEQAQAEGRKQIARLFRATAQSEHIHALAEMRMGGEIRSTSENLQNAIDTEEQEYQKIYPRFLGEAMREEHGEAARLLRNILVVERNHHKIYRQALAAARGGEDLPDTPVFVCGACGNTVTGEAPDLCPVCGAAKRQFTEVL